MKVTSSTDSFHLCHTLRFTYSANASLLRENEPGTTIKTSLQNIEVEPHLGPKNS